MKSTFLQSMKTLFMTNLFFILRQKLKPITKIYFQKVASSASLKLGISVANKVSLL
jgi:hypothetical protein